MGRLQSHDQVEVLTSEERHRCRREERVGVVSYSVKVVSRQPPSQRGLVMVAGAVWLRHGGVAALILDTASDGHSGRVAFARVRQTVDLVVGRGLDDSREELLVDWTAKHAARHGQCGHDSPWHNLRRRYVLGTTVPSMALLTTALRTMALLAMALLAMALLTMALLTMELLTMALLTMALLTMALPTMALLTMAADLRCASKS